MKNSVHLDAAKHPFTGGGGKTIKPSLARMTGVGPKPGGDGDKQSANSQMKAKGILQGAGKA